MRPEVEGRMSRKPSTKARLKVVSRAMLNRTSLHCDWISMMISDLLDPWLTLGKNKVLAALHHIEMDKQSASR